MLEHLFVDWPCYAHKRASRGSVQWTQDELTEHYETDNPWPTWAKADATRSFRSPYRDDNAWPDSVTRTLFGAVLEPWDWIGWAGNVLDALLGAEVKLDEAEEHAVEMLDRLAEVLADEVDGSTHAVARVLARIIVDKGVSIKTEPGQTPQETLFEAFCWHLGVEGTHGWQPSLPSQQFPFWGCLPPIRTVHKPKGGFNESRWPQSVENGTADWHFDISNPPE